MTTTTRRCIGSKTFGIAAHDAPLADFPVQPSRKDSLGTMCQLHWREYTRALGQARRARGDAPAPKAPRRKGQPEPIKTKPARRARLVAQAAEGEPDIA